MLWSICPRMPARGSRRLGLKLRLSQNVQPPVATVPSTFGQVKPASMTDLLHAPAEPLPQCKVTGEIRQSGLTPGQAGVGRRKWFG